MVNSTLVPIFYSQSGIIFHEIAAGIAALTAVAVALVIIRYVVLYGFACRSEIVAAFGLLLFVLGSGVREAIYWLKIHWVGYHFEIYPRLFFFIVLAACAATIVGGALCVFGFLPRHHRAPVVLTTGAVIFTLMVVSVALL